MNSIIVKLLKNPQPGQPTYYTAKLEKSENGVFGCGATVEKAVEELAKKAGDKVRELEIKVC